jgi:hypothetical protein
MTKPTGSLMKKKFGPSIVSQAVGDGHASLGIGIAVPQLRPSVKAQTCAQIFNK